MENFHWKEYWSLLKKELQRNYANISEDDLQYVDGKEEEMMSMLQQKLGKSEEEVNRMLFLLLIAADDEEEEEAEIEEIIEQIEKDMAKDRYLSHKK